MSETTLTVVFGGEIPLDLFIQSMDRFRKLVGALSSEVSGNADISWVIDDLASGSAIATIRGESAEPADVERVVKAYAVVGRSLERGATIPYSPQVVHAARSLTAVLNGSVTSIRFETADETATVQTSTAPAARANLSAFGTIEGRVETLQSRHRLSFTLYDALNDRAVSCFRTPDQRDLVRDAWDKRVIVEGWIKRDPVTGRPVEIGPVEDVVVLPDVTPGSYRMARAIAPARPDAPSAEDAIRRLRDA
jgi:hypothetical protein